MTDSLGFYQKMARNVYAIEKIKKINEENKKMKEFTLNFYKKEEYV